MPWSVHILYHYEFYHVDASLSADELVGYSYTMARGIVDTTLTRSVTDLFTRDTRH